GRLAVPRPPRPDDHPVERRPRGPRRRSADPHGRRAAPLRLPPLGVRVRRAPLRAPPGPDAGGARGPPALDPSMAPLLPLAPGRHLMSTSRIPAFHRMPVEERRRKLAGALDLSPADLETLGALHALPLEVADTMVENALGTFALPFGVALNFLVNGREHVIPMVVEEPSVIAAASSAALVARAAGGFVAEADPGTMI